jgi:co-chaperonin GroES (HSP10)
MKLKLLHDRVLVREVKPVLSSVLVVPEQVDDGFVKELCQGEVVDVGPGLKVDTRKRDSMWDLTPGMVVKYSPVCSTPVGDGLVLIRRDAVAGVLV